MKRRSATSWEELRALDGFRDAVDKAELNQARLVGEYEMSNASPMQACGIRQCRTKHRKGFIVELVEGAISHVGGYCGKKHFGAAWKARLRAYREAAKAEAEAIALVEIRGRAENVLCSPLLPPEHLARVRQMLSAFDALPIELRDSLIAKAQDRDPQISRSRPPTPKEISDAKFHGKPRPSQVKDVIGTITGLRAIMRSRRADYLFDDELPAQLDVIRSSLHGGDGDEIFEALRSFNTSKEQLAESIRESLLFFTQENLGQLRMMPASIRLKILSVSVIDHPVFKIEIHLP